MSDTETLDWVQQYGAQVWCEKGTWHLFLRVSGNLPIQQAGGRLRAVIEAAATALSALKF